MAKKIEVIKASGEHQFFDRDKFCSSLEKAGADRELTDRVCSLIEKDARDGMRTEELFHKAAAYLSRINAAIAARYSLKRAIMEMGPAGFLFEKYLGKILGEYGYKTKLNQIMKGHCVSHEVDILAERDKTHYFVEAKYRNQRDLKVDVTDVMYLYARYVDLERARREKEKGKFLHRPWLITNTKFTAKAINYGRCMNIKLSGWNYPEGGGLEDLVDKKGLYPITVLPSLNRYAREHFSEAGIMLARDLIGISAEDMRKEFAIYPDLAHILAEEVESLYHG